MAAQLTAPAVVRRHAVFHDLRVAEVAPLTADSVTVTFEVPAELAEEYSFVQGQHVSLRCRPAGDEVRRNYSICAPAGSGLLRVAVKKLPGGVFSSYAHAVAGHTAEAQKYLDRLLGMSQSIYMSPGYLAVAYIGLKDYEKAFECLYKAYEARDSMLLFLRVLNVYDPLRSDPRFADLLVKAGLGESAAHAN